jgi:hypothetical protein
VTGFLKYGFFTVFYTVYCTENTSIIKIGHSMIPQPDTDNILDIPLHSRKFRPSLPLYKIISPKKFPTSGPPYKKILG